MTFIKAWLFNFFVGPFIGQVIDQALRERLKEYYKNQREHHQEMLKIQLDNQANMSAFLRKGDEDDGVGQRHKEFMEALKDISNQIGQAK